MKNIEQIKQYITDIAFEVSLSDEDVNAISPHNPHQLSVFLEELGNEHQEEISNNVDLKVAVDGLKHLLDEHNKEPMLLTKDELKEVYQKLKDRELHPKGKWDSRGCFWLEDAELVDVRKPSPRYPYSQMQAGRTSKFVKSMAEKYKPQSLQEFLEYFSVAK